MWASKARTTRTPALIKNIKSKIKSNPIRSMRKMAREAGESEGTIRKIIKDDLKAKSRARTSQAQSKLKGCKIQKGYSTFSKIEKSQKSYFLIRRFSTLILYITVEIILI